jgi:hypothetical protein
MLKTLVGLLFVALLAAGNGAFAQNAAIRNQFAQSSREEALKHSGSPVDNITTGGPDGTFFVFHQAEIKHEWCDDISKNQPFAAVLQSMGFTEIICSYGNGNARFVFDLLTQEQPAPAQTQSQPTSTCRITPQDMDLAHKAIDLATRIINDLRASHANRTANMSDRRKVLQRILPQMNELKDINEQLRSLNSTVSPYAVVRECPIEIAREWARLLTENANLMDQANVEVNSYLALIQ